MGLLQLIHTCNIAAFGGALRSISRLASAPMQSMTQEMNNN